MKKILVIGATSAIAQEAARIWAREGDSFFLVARQADHLADVARDLEVRGAKQVATSLLDVTRHDQHQSLLDQAVATLGGLDIAFLAYGALPSQELCEQDVSKALAALDVNFQSVVSILLRLANYFEQRKSGSIAVISSVAGERGRRSNYLYGSAKGAISLFLQGLRARLYPAGVHVLTIKPGFVDTPMTASMKKNFLFASPQQVASGIVRAIEKRKDIVYLPWFWRWILLMVRLVPERVFKRI